MIINQISNKLTAKYADGSIIIPSEITKIDVDCLTNFNELVVIFHVNHQSLYPKFDNTHSILQRRKDYLWEDTCFECFISHHYQKNAPYIEINISPTGAFNLYYFDGYRNPQQMPPRQLIDGIDLTTDINFIAIFPEKNLTQPKILTWQPMTIIFEKFLQDIMKRCSVKLQSCQFIMCLNWIKIAKLFENENLSTKIWLNPCVVTKSAKKPLSYWATNHANPPDFHDKSCWVAL